MGISLADALNAGPNNRMMRVDQVLEGELSKADTETFRAALNNLNVPARRIEGALAKLEPPVVCSGTAITNWRRKNGVR